MDKVRSDCPALPTGWIREVVVRKSGVSAGRSDIYYYSPDGKKYRSKPQIAQKLGDTFDTANFDFRTGSISEATSRARRRKGKTDFHYGKDLSHGNIAAPRRQMRKVIQGGAVTLVRGDSSAHEVCAKKDAKGLSSHPNKAKLEELNRVERKPRQLFWEKRMQGMTAVNIKTNNRVSVVRLPDTIKGFKPCQDDGVMFNAIVANLFMNKNGRISGQQISAHALKKNLTASCNPAQPMCGPILLSDHVITDQEKRIEDSRRKLSEALELLKALEDEDEELDSEDEMANDEKAKDETSDGEKVDDETANDEKESDGAANDAMTIDVKASDETANDEMASDEKANDEVADDEMAKDDS